MRILKISFTLVGLFLVAFSILLVNYNGYVVREDIELREIPQIKPKEGLVSFTFDDGLLNYYTKVYPAMRLSGLNGTIYAMANWTEDGARFEGNPLIKFPQLYEMQQNGWEIASHGVAHKRMTNLSDSDLEEELSLSKKILEDNGLDIVSFAFPFGHFDERSIEGAKKHYITARPLLLGYNEKENIDWFKLRSRWIMNMHSAEEVCGWISYAKERDYWLILTFHNIEENKLTKWEISLSDFDKILNCTLEIGIPVKTIREVEKEYRNKNSQ